MNKFIETIRQYSATLKLIASDSVWRFKEESVFILLAGFLGTSFQLLTIALAIYYAHTLEKGGMVKLLGYEFQARTSIVLLFLLGTGVFLFLLLSAWLIYFSKTKTIALMRKYEAFCSKRILSLFGSSVKVWVPPNQSFADDRTIFRIVRIDSRNNSRALGILLVTVVPAIILLVSVFTLFYTNISLTCLMIVFFGIASFFQYKINIVGVRNSTRMENSIRGATLEYNQIIQRQKGISIPLSKNEFWFEKELFSSGKIKRYIDAYLGRRKVLETSHLVSNILFAITIFVLLLIMGSRIILKADNWSSLIVYLIALRFLLVNLRQLSRQITHLNRFYPQISRYFQFLNNTETLQENGEPHQTNYMILADKPIENSLKSWQLCKGSRLGLISTVKLNRYTLAFIVSCLLGHSKQAAGNALNAAWFMTLNYGNAYSSLREFLSIPSGYSWQDLREELEETGICDKLEQQLSRDLDSSIPPEKWNQAGADLKVVLALLGAIHSEKYWILLEENALRHLSDAALKYFINRLSDRIVVIVSYPNTKTSGRYKEDVIAVLSDNRVAGLGSLAWFEENRHKIFDTPKHIQQNDSYISDSGADSEDLFDDEDI